MSIRETADEWWIHGLAVMLGLHTHRHVTRRWPAVLTCMCVVIMGRVNDALYTTRIHGTMRPQHNHQQALDSPSWFSQRRSTTPHFWGCAPRGAMTPKFELDRDFCTSFIVLCLLVRKLSCWQTNKQTNKQTPLKTSNALRYATTLGN